MSKVLIGLCSIAILTSGCSIFEKSDLSQEEKVTIVFETARAGTFAALQRLDNAEDRVEDLINLIDDTIIPILDSDGQISKETSDLVLSFLPSEYEIYLSPALTSFHAYYETPSLGEIVTEDNLALIRALFDGIRAGAEKFVI